MTTDRVKAKQADKVKQAVEALKEGGACEKALRWLSKQPSLQAAWDNCKVASWMMWVLATREDGYGGGGDGRHYRFEQKVLLLRYPNARKFIRAWNELSGWSNVAEENALIAEMKKAGLSPKVIRHITLETDMRITSDEIRAVYRKEPWSAYCKRSAHKTRE